MIQLNIVSDDLRATCSCTNDEADIEIAVASVSSEIKQISDQQAINRYGKLLKLNMVFFFTEV